MKIVGTGCCLSLLGVGFLRADDTNGPTHFRLDSHGGPKIQNVLVISVDGMYARDLAKWIDAHPDSNLAHLANSGGNYTNAFTTQPSDSIPGTVGIFTGASPSLGGMYYDDAYHRYWAAPTAPCTPGVAGGGTVIDLKDGIDVTPVAPLPASAVLNPAKLPKDPARGCARVYPHDMLRVNTVFEVVRAAGMYTAYSEKRPAYDFLNGPSGTGVQDLYVPEIALATLLIPSTIRDFDQLRVNSILNEINGLNHDGTSAAPVPNLFGMNFQSVNSAKKSSPNSGYDDADGNPDAYLQDALSYVDGAIGSMVQALKDLDLWGKSAVIITAKHGESPVGNTRTTVPTTGVGSIGSILTAAGIPTKRITQKSGGLIWLTNQSQAAAAAAALASNAGFAANVNQIVYSGVAGYPFPDPLVDPAPPDVVVYMKDNVNFEPIPTSTFAEHGGFGEGETHVPLLIASPKVGPFTETAPVSTRQIAPTILRLLGLDPQALQAVQIEGVAVLP
jgi:hypothetical protein